MQSPTPLEYKFIENLNLVKLRFLIIPVALILIIVVSLAITDNLSVHKYIDIQKDLFYVLNGALSKCPALQFNLTQLGDAFVLLPFTTLFIIYAPRLWNALVSACLSAAILSFVLKEIFWIPRPATILDHDSFTILGEKLGGWSSMPSGHSITILTVLSVVMLAWMPKTLKNKVLWSFFVIGLGLFIATTRVGVGAHFPLDVFIGSSIGYISAIVGIVFGQKYFWWAWVKNKKLYPFFILFFAFWIAVILIHVMIEDMPIFYLSILALFTTMILMLLKYAKKEP